jgi:hypothetical protein
MDKDLINSDPDTNANVFDVFVSYNKKDAEWVWEELLPRLERADLRVCIDERDFLIGLPRLVNIERAVDASRHTLIVLTPNWISGEWNEFESLLAGSTDPGGRRRRILPLMLRQTSLPTRIAMLDYADFTSPQRYATQFTRLLQQLTSGQPSGDFGRLSAAPTVGAPSMIASPSQDTAIRIDNRPPSTIPVEDNGPNLLHTTPLLIGIVVDVSRSMMLTMRDIPKRAGLSQRAIQDAITDIRNEVVALCRSEQSQEVLPYVSLFLYAMGLSKTRHVVFDRFLRDAGLYSGAPVNANPVRDLCQDAADKAGLPLTPTASDLDLYWEEYRRSMEAHLGDIILGGPSVLYQGLSIARDRLRHELQSGSFKHALLLVLSDGQLKDGFDTDLLTVSQEIRRLGVDIFSGYIGKRSITRPYTLYGQPGADWPDEAKRLFACSSPLSHDNALISTMHRVMQERNWKIQEEARLFVHITQQKMLRDVVHLLKNVIQLSL